MNAMKNIVTICYIKVMKLLCQTIIELFSRMLPKPTPSLISRIGHLKLPWISNSSGFDSKLAHFRPCLGNRGAHSHTSYPFRAELHQHQPSIRQDAQVTPDVFELVSSDLKTMFQEIHEELESNNRFKNNHEIQNLAKYYFDGKGKAVRPVIAMTIGHAVNYHCGKQKDSEIISQQRKVAIISEMIHTASLVHDDILDRADTRRGKPSINFKWNNHKSTLIGDYILAVGAQVLARLRNEEVLIVLAQVLADLVKGEFQQLQKTTDEPKQFQKYLRKTFNKTASLIAHSCKANAILASAPPDLIEASFQYGKNVGIAFQLIDDLLDFETSSELLGKPAGADLKLGLATAPVLFATAQHPHLELMVQRHFSEPGDVESAFQAVLSSDGIERTRELAAKHVGMAVESIKDMRDSAYKSGLLQLTERMLQRKK